MLALIAATSAFARPQLSRRAVLGGGAAATLAVQPGFAAKPKETLADRVTRLDKETPASDRNALGAAADHLPQLTIYGTQTKVTSGGLAAQVEMIVQHVQDPDDFVEYMWIKDATSQKVYAAKKFRVSDPSPPLLVAALPLGATVVPVAFFSATGMWVGEPQLVSKDANAYTPGFQEGVSLVK